MSGGVVALENSVLRAGFDSVTGLSTRLTNKKIAQSIDIAQNFYQYFSTYLNETGGGGKAKGRNQRGWNTIPR